MKDNILPEEKLLRLIKAHKKAKVVPELVLENKELPKRARHFSFGLPNVHFKAVVKFIFFISLFYLTISFAHPFFVSDKIKLPQVEAKEKIQTKINSSINKPLLKPYDFYSSGINGRRIFSGTAANLEKPIGTASADLIKDINLVGIVSGEEPQAIIEDKKAQKTYYLRKGQFMGELELAEILEGKIILSYEGQMYELYL